MRGLGMVVVVALMVTALEARGDGNSLSADRVPEDWIDPQQGVALRLERQCGALAQFRLTGGSYQNVLLMTLKNTTKERIVFQPGQATFRWSNGRERFASYSVAQDLQEVEPGDVRTFNFPFPEKSDFRDGESFVAEIPLIDSKAAKRCVIQTEFKRFAPAQTLTYTRYAASAGSLEFQMALPSVSRFKGGWDGLWGIRFNFEQSVSWLGVVGTLGVSSHARSSGSSIVGLDYGARLAIQGLLSSQWVPRFEVGPLLKLLWTDESMSTGVALETRFVVDLKVRRDRFAARDHDQYLGLTLGHLWMAPVRVGNETVQLSAITLGLEWRNGLEAFPAGNR